MRHIKFILPIFLLCYVSCKKDTSPISATPPNAYEYQAFDTTGTLVVNGWFKFKVIETDPSDDEVNYLSIEGEWHLNKIGDPENIGKQVGDGILNGTIENDKIWVNLNPNIADDNVILHGNIDGKKIEGHWYYSIFVGAINGGPFKAEKK